MFDFNSTTAKQLLAQLKIHEGCIKNAKGVHICYQCPADKLTIGYGHNLDANPVRGINNNSELSEVQAESLLLDDVKKIYEQVKTFPFEKELDPIRTAVLINMAFNMGMGSLRTFKNTLNYISQGQYDEAAENMLQSKWARQVGKRAKNLAEQMKTGQWA